MKLNRDQFELWTAFTAIVRVEIILDKMWDMLSGLDLSGEHFLMQAMLDTNNKNGEAFNDLWERVTLLDEVTRRENEAKGNQRAD